MRRIQWLVGGAALALAVLAGHRQLLVPTALTTRDHTDSYLRTEQYVRELADGHWPQILPDAVAGGGSAFPRYYPPLSQWTAVGLYRLTGDVVTANHLAGLAAILLAALACFVALGLLGAGILPAAVGSALYSLLPYAWVALNIRGAFAETWALGFYPFILAGVILSLRRDTPVVWLPLAVAGAAASHLVMTAWAIPALAVVGLVTAGPHVRWSSVWRTTGAGALGIGLTAFFILPALVEAGMLRAADPVLMRATPEHLAGVRWPYYETVFRSFRWWNQLEWGLLAMGLLGLWQVRRDAGLLRRLCWASLTGYALLAILVRAPVELWRLVPQPLRYLQFPERLLGIAGLLLAATLAAATSGLRTALGRVTLAGLGATLVLYAYYLGREALPRSGENHAQLITRLKSSYPDRGLTVVGEYLPAGVEPESLAASIRRTRSQVGTGLLRTWTKRDGGFEARVELRDAGEVAFPLVSYPLYRVRNDSGPIATGSREGQLTARLGAGAHTVQVQRRWPAVTWFGLSLSLLSMALYARFFSGWAASSRITRGRIQRQTDTARSAPAITSTT